MASIGSRSFALEPTTDKYLSLTGEEWVRTMSIGSTWDRLRVGLMVAIVPNGTSDILSATLQVGVCSGSTNTLRTPTTTNGYFDLVTSEDTTLTYNAGGGNPYHVVTSRTFGKRVGSTTTLGSAATEDHYLPTTTGSTQRRAPIYVEFNKTGALLTFYGWNTASFVQQDYSRAQFLDGLQTSGTPTVGGNLMVPSSQTTQIFSDAAGGLDTISVYWNKAGFALEVYALSAYRFA